MFNIIILVQTNKFIICWSKDKNIINNETIRSKPQLQLSLRLFCMLMKTELDSCIRQRSCDLTAMRVFCCDSCSRALSGVYFSRIASCSGAAASCVCNNKINLVNANALQLPLPAIIDCWREREQER